MAENDHEVSQNESTPSNAGGSVPSDQGGQEQPEAASGFERDLPDQFSEEEGESEGAFEDLVEDDDDGLGRMVGELEDVEGFDTTGVTDEGVECEGEEEGEFEEGELREDLDWDDLGELQALDTEFIQAEEQEFEQPESVCGRDDRVRISPTTRIPWRLNCKLIITLANGRRGGCTGFFIGPRTVMTAGHCVYSHSNGGWARRITVVPGMDVIGGRVRRPFGYQVGTSFRSVRGWTRNRSPNYDYGAIILPNTRLGRRVGWFGFAALSARTLRRLYINNAGYAGDKPFGTLWYNGGRITRVTSRRLYYFIDTYGGHSGSPVWRLVRRRGRWQRHVVGVHAYGGCPNKATRIVRPVFANMLRWRRGL